MPVSVVQQLEKRGYSVHDAALRLLNTHSGERIVCVDNNSAADIQLRYKYILTIAGEHDAIEQPHCFGPHRKRQKAIDAEALNVLGGWNAVLVGWYQILRDQCRETAGYLYSISDGSVCLVCYEWWRIVYSHHFVDMIEYLRNNASNNIVIHNLDTDAAFSVLFGLGLIEGQEGNR